MIMARFRRQMALRPVQRIKHVVDSSATLAKNTVLPQTMVNTVDAPVLANVADIVTGSKVYGIYLNIQVASNEAHVAGAIPNVYLIVAKNPGGNLAFNNPNAIGSDDNKRYVIHQEMILIENQGAGSNPKTLFNGVVKIPKGYSRFGPNDLLIIEVFCPQLDIAFCVQAHYKEFR